MKIKRDDIKYYIDREFIYPEKEMIRSFLFGLLIVCLPIAIFGAYSNITRIVMLPIIIVMSIWAILLLRNPINQNIFNLFCGIFSLFFSLSCLTLALKLDQGVSTKTILLVLGLYFLCIAANVISNVQLINKGYYRQRKKHMNIIPIVSLIGFVGVVFGRKLLGAIDQNMIDDIFIIVFVIAAFNFSLGTSGILRYYLAIKVED